MRQTEHSSIESNKNVVQVCFISQLYCLQLLLMFNKVIIYNKEHNQAKIRPSSVLAILKIMLVNLNEVNALTYYTLKVCFCIHYFNFYEK